MPSTARTSPAPVLTSVWSPLPSSNGGMRSLRGPVFSPVSAAFHGLLQARRRHLPTVWSPNAKACFLIALPPFFLLSGGRSLLRAARILREGTPCCKRRHRRQRRQAPRYQQRIGVIAPPLAQRAAEPQPRRLLQHLHRPRHHAV